jgi:phosphoribosylglycinamide formyltransferase-1
MRIALLASHQGSTLQAVIDAYQAGRLRAVPAVVISNNSSSEALRRALRAGIPQVHLSHANRPAPGQLAEAMLECFEHHQVEWVVLVGYMKRLEPEVIARYRGRIINTHPALLPKFGGQGMFGMRVHEAVIASGDPQCGASVHLVDEQYDTGAVIRQASVPVFLKDTPEALCERVQVREKSLLVEVLDQLAGGEISLPSGPTQA